MARTRVHYKEDKEFVHGITRISVEIKNSYGNLNGGGILILF